jgi:hypothetical protein
MLVKNLEKYDVKYNKKINGGRNGSVRRASNSAGIISGLKEPVLLLPQSLWLKPLSTHTLAFTCMWSGYYSLSASTKEGRLSGCRERQKNFFTGKCLYFLTLQQCIVFIKTCI